MPSVQTELPLEIVRCFIFYHQVGIFIEQRREGWGGGGANGGMIIFRGSSISIISIELNTKHRQMGD